MTEQKLAMEKLSLLDGKELFTDENSYGELQAAGMVRVKEYVRDTNDPSILRYDGNTLVNTKYLVCARPLMAQVIYHEHGDDQNA